MKKTWITLAALTGVAVCAAGLYKNREKIWHDFFKKDDKNEPDAIPAEVNEGAEEEIQEDAPVLACESQEQPVSDEVCYYTKGGSVWHYDRWCMTLTKSTNVCSGTVEQAAGEGKTRPCSLCGE